MALLGMRTVSDAGDLVCDFERCALLPFRDRDAAPRMSLRPSASCGKFGLPTM